MKPIEQQIHDFQKAVYAYYKNHGRDLPWRKTKNPYRILISEIMLQQTQVERVIPKYKEFLKAFPDFEALGTGSQTHVYAVWQGLGYNRRALFLKELGETVHYVFGGKFPKDPDELEKLPGVGHYTARAIAAFAYNLPEVFIETNIRRVFIHHFFKDRADVHDSEILPLIEKTLDTKNPREWYWALMDYGSSLSSSVENPNRQSAHYAKQKPFSGSDRQMRGLIVKFLLEEESATELAITKHIQQSATRTERILQKLMREGIVHKEKRSYTLNEKK